MEIVGLDQGGMIDIFLVTSLCCRTWPQREVPCWLLEISPNLRRGRLPQLGRGTFGANRRNLLPNLNFHHGHFKIHLHRDCTGLPSFCPPLIPICLTCIVQGLIVCFCGDCIMHSFLKTHFFPFVCGNRILFPSFQTQIFVSSYFAKHFLCPFFLPFLFGNTFLFPFFSSHFLFSWTHIIVFILRQRLIELVPIYWTCSILTGVFNNE